MIQEPPEAIMITISQGMIKDHGYRHWLRIFLQCMDYDGCSYWFRQGAAPRYRNNLLYVYLCAGGKVRFRCNYVYSTGPKEMTFEGPVPKTMFAKSWLVLCGPVVRPPYPIEQKGFRGFRYCDILF